MSLNLARLCDSLKKGKSAQTKRRFSEAASGSKRPRPQHASVDPTALPRGFTLYTRTPSSDGTSPPTVTKAVRAPAAAEQVTGPADAVVDAVEQFIVDPIHGKLPNLNALPAKYASDGQVHSLCDIPQFLVDINPRTRLDEFIAEHGDEMFTGITFLEGPHQYWLSAESHDRVFSENPNLCKIHPLSVSQNAPDEVKSGWKRHLFSASATKVAGSCFSPFDANDAISKILRSRNYHKADYEYNGMTADEIKRHWLAANLLGTMLHYFIELFYNDYEDRIPDCMKDKPWWQFKTFHEEIMRGNYEPVLTELRVYDLEYDFAGSVDGVFVRTAEKEAAAREGRLPKLTLFDWKRCKPFKMKSFTGETAAEPLECFPDASFYKYSMQLNLYKHVIERNTNHRIEAMYLVRFNPASDNYEMRQVSNYQPHVAKLLAVHKARLAVSRQSRQ